MRSHVARKLAVSVDASVFPVTVDELKLHIRQSSSMGSVEDSMLQMMISAASVAVENDIGQSISARTLVMSLGDFPTYPVVLWYPKVASVSSLEYYDGDNVLTVADPATYDLELAGLRPTVSLSYGKTWPVARERPFPVKITYVTAASTDPVLKLAVLMTAADFYENRESQIVSQYFGERSVIANPAISRMLNPYRISS